MDDADRSDQRITDTVDDGIQASRRALNNSLSIAASATIASRPFPLAGCSARRSAMLTGRTRKIERRKDLGL